ncbi:MAG: pilus assembly protein TadG-related protein [Hyphomicrobium sp.]
MGMLRIRLREFPRREDGAVGVVFGLAIIVLLGLAGAAVDFSRWHNAQTRTSEALDTAVLAAGRHLQVDPDNTTAAIAAAEAYFANAIKGRIPVFAENANFQMSPDGLAIEGTVTAKIATPLLKLVKTSDLPISANARAVLGIGGGNGSSNVEISVMLDVTGSMCDDGVGPCTTSSKLDALKVAAKDLINVVINPNVPDEVARVAIVPFSTRVRVGSWSGSQTPDLMKPLTDVDSTFSGWYTYCTDWTVTGGGSEQNYSYTCNTVATNYYPDEKIKPCVSDRNGPEEFTDKAPGPGAWLNAADGSRFPVSRDSTDIPITAGSGTGASSSDPASGWNHGNSGYCDDEHENNGIVPLSADKTMLHAQIDGLSAYGATAGALGTAWAWYMLSPEWSNIWTGASTPGSYDDLTALSAGGSPKLRKIAVLMTDGQYNTYRSWKGQNPDDVSNNAKSLCANMKAKGLEIYTVGFDLDSLPAADKARATDTLQTCGSDLSHFYYAQDNEQLKQAFRDIAIKLSTLYIAN